MNGSGKQISNPFSTGGGGQNFEVHVHAYFVILMLTDSFAPCLPRWPIYKIKFQGRFAGYNTDDLIIFAKNPANGQERKILGQIKHSISISEKDKTFSKVIRAAWEDFNNRELFNKGEDVIVLITGPLSITDVNDVRTILEWSRDSESADEFIRKVKLARFSSDNKRKKLQAFKTNLKKANYGKDVPDETLWEFLRHFHLLGYDLDIKSGVILSLLHSLIGQYTNEDPHSLWTQIVDEIQYVNENAGTISIDTLPKELTKVFKHSADSEIPSDLAIKRASSEIISDWNQLPNAFNLAIANLVGSWDEKNDADREFISKIAGEDYNVWIIPIREILQKPDSPITLRNGIWCVTKRHALLKALGSRVFDEHLYKFKEYAISIFSERDPKFYLPSGERYVARIRGNVLKYSSELRQGLADTLALLGNNPDTLTYCNSHERHNISNLVVREVLDNADWVLWGSLNYLLPALAEAAPDEFLNIVESTLKQSSCPFDKLFSQEEEGIFGENYLTGLLWALETLAWEEQFIVRVCMILGELAERDPGGGSTNRPANSLTKILLPWLPQTTASINKRKVAIQTLKRESTKVAWKLLLSLLPGQTITSSHTRKPKWRSVNPENWDERVPRDEYLEQVYFYADLTVSMAIDDLEKTIELVQHLDGLPIPSLEKFLDYLSSDSICKRPEEQRLPVWTELVAMVSKHKRFHDADWAFDSETISRIEEVSAKLAPINPLNLYQHLFRNLDFDLYERDGNWDERRQKLEGRRKEAINIILDYGGIDAIIKFAGIVEAPYKVGLFLGAISNADIDAKMLPFFLDVDDKEITQLMNGYIWGRHYEHGWSWVDELDTSDWSITQLAQFLSYLPFTEETWLRAARWLVDSEKEYWIRTSANPYQAKSSLETAVNKLIKYGRPRAALNCIYNMLNNKHSLDSSQIVKALLAATTSEEPSYTVDTYHILEIIEALQSTPEIDPEDLFQVEWVYLPLLDHYRGASPKLLEKRLANDPAFFCKVIRFVYRSKKESKSEREPNEEEKAFITKAWKLLRKWRTPPGTQSNGEFSLKQFKQWLEYVKKECRESGHLEVALEHTGQVLFYCQPDTAGLWINRNAAEVLDDKDADQIRHGFWLEAIYSRGPHKVDPSGKPEMDLAEKYNRQAEEIENAGYPRFAVTLREIAEYYNREAKRIIADHSVKDVE